MTEYYVDPSVKGCIRIFPEQGRYGYYRYDMNENPEGLPKEFVDKVLKEITPEFLATYPEPDVFLEKYAAFIGMGYENVLTTNGSDMAIRYLLEIFCRKGKKVVTVNPSFEMYAVNCSILGLEHVPVRYEDDMTVDINKLLDAINPDTDMVVLLNPNNPIGTAYTDEEVNLVIKRAEENGAVVILDEAYHYFYGRTFVDKVLQHDNVVVLRTFSKLFSLAACRLGVIISNRDIIDYIRKSRLTFEVNAVALKFAEHLVEQPELIEYLIASEKRGKKYVLDELSRRDYETMDGLGNYIFIKTHGEPSKIADILKHKEKILVKTFGSSLLKDYIRVSTGSEKAMKFFTDKFLKVDC
ncbi:MAG TPA: histidinol phosphate aminotransferase [Lachnospiraceae bacterium]|nr:histidinol phosphate aminotransferase [Lachnospiraceae bacterium]